MRILHGDWHRFHIVRRRRPGASAVELAFVLPLLLLLGIGGVESGRALSTHIAVSNAARVGADWAATHRFTADTRAAWEGKIRDETTAEMESVPGFIPGNLETGIQTVDVDETVRVTVSATYQHNTAIDWPGLPSVFTLRRQVTACQYR